MEQGNPYSEILKIFEIRECDVRAVSPITLAFIGDCVYELVVRTVVAQMSAGAADHLQEKSSAFAKASAQSKIARIIAPHLSEEEALEYKRGRNAHPLSVAKNATVSDYRKATGLEALVGYLYITDRFPRAVELIRLGMDGLGSEGQE